MAYASARWLLLSAIPSLSGALRPAHPPAIDRRAATSACAAAAASLLAPRWPPWSDPWQSLRAAAYDSGDLPVSTIDLSKAPAKATAKCYLDVSAGGAPLGRIVVELVRPRPNRRRHPARMCTSPSHQACASAAVRRGVSTGGREFPRAVYRREGLRILRI